MADPVSPPTQQEPRYSNKSVEEIAALEAVAEAAKRECSYDFTETWTAIERLEEIRSVR